MKTILCKPQTCHTVLIQYVNAENYYIGEREHEIEQEQPLLILDAAKKYRFGVKVLNLGNLKIGFVNVVDISKGNIIGLDDSNQKLLDKFSQARIKHIEDDLTEAEHHY